MAKNVEITLKKEGAEDIVIKCPPKIKIHPAMAAIVALYGCPPAAIKPTQGKDILKDWALFAGIFVASALFIIPVVGIVAFIVMIVLNIRFNKNYFYNFIKKRLEEGYSVEQEEHKQLLRDAGLPVDSVQSSPALSSSSVSVTSAAPKVSQEDAFGQLEKLASLKEKGILSDEEFAAQKAKILGSK